MLRRAMQIRALTLTQVVATAGGHIVAVFWAWQYHSYWALVLRPIVTAVLQAIGSWWACPWVPGLPRRGTGMRQMASFGFNLAAFNLLNYLARNVDYMLIGWRWGATSLGFYERAYRLLMLPVNQINVPATNVAIPALSRLQNEPAKYVKAYESMIGKLVFGVGALVGFLLATSDWVIQIVYGERWLAAIPIFQWLGLVAVRQVFLNTTGWLFVSQGRGKEMLQWACIGVPISIASFVIGLPYGPKGIAIAYAIIPLVVGSPILLWMLGRSGPLSTWYLWKSFLHAMSIPLVVAGITYTARWMLQPNSEWVGICVLAPLTFVITLVLMFSTAYGRRQFWELVNAISHLGRRIT
jgi:PST family polysaccharide transporter